MKLTIRVKGRPAPQGSKSLGSAGQLLEQSPYLPAWRTAVKVGAYKAYQEAGISHTELPLFRAGTPVTVEWCVFLLHPEQCRIEGSDLPLGEPDVDKLLRSTLDALGGAKKWATARVFADDAQVWRVCDLSKRRPQVGEDPGAFIIISNE